MLLLLDVPGTNKKAFKLVGGRARLYRHPFCNGKAQLELKLFSRATKFTLEGIFCTESYLRKVGNGLYTCGAEVVAVAVRGCGASLRYAAPELRGDRALVLAGVQNDALAWQSPAAAPPAPMLSFLLFRASTSWDLKMGPLFGQIFRKIR